MKLILLGLEHFFPGSNSAFYTRSKYYPSDPIVHNYMWPFTSHAYIEAYFVSYTSFLSFIYCTFSGFMHLNSFKVHVSCLYIMMDVGF